MTIHHTIPFQASKKRVWEILTESEHSRHYMFGCDMLSDWQVGSDLLWEGPDGKGGKVVYVTGKVLAYEPFDRLQFSLFPKGASYPDIPENRIVQTMTLEEKYGVTTVELEQTGFDTVADGEKRFAESNQGWEMVIEQMQARARYE